MLLYALGVFFGFVLLVKSADVFSASAIAISNLLHISPFLIAITLIPLGTSAPELFVSIVAALDGAPLIATGNVIGSNIINITLGIGIAALL
ncbi:sodium:calcium antiporter, partial [Gammaproteobacteria bacterium]|nr:sodium:calcium antiporter [Gammaproteobacteria bacterium]